MANSMGRMAYEAYRQYLASLANTATEKLSNPEWEELDIALREAWQAAAEAVARWNGQEVSVA
jgi:hypothetical protein